jgi:hypothetical protein
MGNDVKTCNSGLTSLDNPEPLITSFRNSKQLIP